ncbi:MAG: hypothetical protein JNK94_04065 [Hyphomonadaceae bacterium]|nr:hypothetical protein [Hyphomonadaceae bacterium]
MAKKSSSVIAGHVARATERVIGGATMDEAAVEAGIPAATLRLWCESYGGLSAREIERSRLLARKNRTLRRRLVELRARQRVAAL